MGLRKWWVCGLWIVAAAVIGTAVRADDSGAGGGGYQVVVDPSNSLSMAFGQDGKKLIEIAPSAWGADGSAITLPTITVPEKDGSLRYSVPCNFNKDTHSIIHLDADISLNAKHALVCKYEMSARKNVSLSMVALGITEGSDEGKLVATTAHGSTRKLALPNPQAEDIADVAKLDFEIGGAKLDIALDPPVTVSFDEGNPHIKLIGKASAGDNVTPSSTFLAGKKTVTVTISAPGPLAFAAPAAPPPPPPLVSDMPADQGDWFAFTPANDSGKSVIGMQDWLEAPAGRHGGVRMVKDQFQFTDGTPVKFWGTNLAYASNCAPTKQWADITAARFAKYGINGVRLHKFTTERGPGGFVEQNNTVKLVPAGVDRFDYFLARLKSEGIYYGFSHTYGFEVGSENAPALMDYDEIAHNLGGATSGLINVAPDIQNLLIERIVNLLTHVNPYTRLRYAQDPALSYIEIQNEDDVFWFDLSGKLAKAPNYRKAVERLFSQWLGKKYGSQAKLAQAWKGALQAGQTITDGDISLQANPWFFSEDHLPGIHGGDRQALLDSAAFLHACQDDFYGRTVRAIRQTGYQGPICGSPWQAPGGLPAIYNLASDSAAGFIDRHNYGGGNPDYDLLDHVGGGFMTVGLQQVMDRPFGFSEWITQYPALYNADGPAVVAAYGLGLQGWDASYEFQSNSNHAGFSEQENTVNGPWDADTPTQIGQFPTLARMIYRADVKEGKIIADRRISPENLATGKFDFSDKIVQSGDFKNFGGSVPPAALAAGRVVNEFTEHSEPSEFPDMSKYLDGSAVVSETGQLRWDPTDHGFVTIDTDGTKAIVGFAAGKPQTFGKVKMTVNSPYASVILTASEKGQTLSNCSTALVSAIGVIRNGGGGIEMQAVKADITIAGRTIRAVNVLDQDGRLTVKTIPILDGAFSIDTGAQKTMYYQVVFAR
jgi:hypothetical protein